MAFEIGQRVLVHQSGGMTCINDVWHSVPHNCSEPAQHWKSRVLSYDSYGRPVIATSAEKNPCHAEWPYTDDSLTELNDGTTDWVLQSSFTAGQIVHFTLDTSTPQYAAGTRLEAVLEVPHIEVGDWYVSFPTPDGWRFKMVVPESRLEM